jgi:hypothetical protein
MNGSTTLGTGTLTNGVATLQTSSLAVGTDALTAVYSGDTNFLTSTSAAVNQQVNLGTTIITITVSNPNPFPNQSFTATAAVTVNNGFASPTGSVTFFDINGTNLGTGTLTNGLATVAVPAFKLTLGEETITAVYSGDSNFNGMKSQPASLVVGSNNQLYINQVYLTVFGASGYGFGLDYWTVRLNNGNSRHAVVSGILGSSQKKTGLAPIRHARGVRAKIETAYKLILGRPATSRELRHDTAVIDQGGTITQLVTALLVSNEYYDMATTT